MSPEANHCLQATLDSVFLVILPQISGAPDATIGPQ